MMGFSNRLCRQELRAERILEEKFINHVEEWGLQLGTKAEFDFRFQVFAEKDQFIAETNAKQSSFALGHNLFSTMTYEEAKRYTMTVMPQPEAEPKYTLLDDTNLSASRDWRGEGGVNAVKNQGHCGSCWAFSATCAVEFAAWKASKSLPSLSEQQLVSCDKTCYGCNGGWQYKAFQYLESNPHATESHYPYTSGTGQTGSCSVAQAAGGRVTVTGYTNVPSRSVSQLKAAIDKGVVSVTIEADKSVFQLYHSGVFDSAACGTQLDHAVAAVGYGTEGGKDYYIVRNSWSASWGDQGYIKIAAVDGAGICGIQLGSLYP